MRGVHIPIVQSSARQTATFRLHLRRHFSSRAMAPTSASLAVIAGVGPGTGASIARKFSQTYPVVLLARSPANYESLVAEGGRAWGIATDVSDTRSVDDAFATITKLGSTIDGDGAGAEAAATTKIAAAVFNVGGGLVRKPFLDLSLQEFEAGFTSNGIGAFNFARAVLPFLLASAPLSDASVVTTVTNSGPAGHPPTLIFTGATASLRGGPQLAAFASGKFALRAVAQSLAREFGPKGVHVAHVVVDGVIDVPKTAQWQIPGADSKIDPRAIADAYWYLHTQPRSMWTHEQDIRPWLEKF